jgi:hypothetical protein
MPRMSSHLAEVLAAGASVDPAYRHHPKRVTIEEPLEVPGAVLKWYGVHADGIPESISRLAREHLVKTPLEARGFGFVVLHRCGEGFYFLIVCTWNGSNELWQTVFYKNGDAMAEFALWPRPGQHIPTYCVWELVAVLHEQQAWVRFLSSKRDEAAARAWLANRYSGPA